MQKLMNDLLSYTFNTYTIVQRHCEEEERRRGNLPFKTNTFITLQTHLP